MTKNDKTRVMISLAPEVKTFLEQCAEYDGTSLSAEVTRSVRERMERTAAANRATVAAE